MARIMVVDDEQIVREILRRMLERDSHQVVEAENGRVALEENRKARADVVVADIFMPEMDGLQLITHLQEESPQTRVVAISGSVYERRRRFLEIAGRMKSVTTLAKPFTAKEVRAAVKRALDPTVTAGEPMLGITTPCEQGQTRPNVPFCQSS